MQPPLSGSTQRPQRPPLLTAADVKVLPGYLSCAHSIATVRLSWLVCAPKTQILPKEHMFYLGYVPCRRVSALGLLVGVSVHEKRIIYTLDDGSGATMECLCWISEQRKEQGWDPEQPFQLGMTVGVMGKIDEYRQCRQLVVESLSLERNPNAESQHLLRCATLQRTKYSRPFSIADEMARVTQDQQLFHSIPSTSQRANVSSTQPQFICPSSDQSADFSSASYVSTSDPASEASYASFNRSDASFTMSMSNLSASSSKLPKPSSLSDGQLSEALLRLYVAAYFIRHSETACSAQSLYKDNIALNRLARRTASKLRKAKGRISDSFRSTKSSQKIEKAQSKDEEALALFDGALRHLMREGLIVTDDDPACDHAPLKGPVQRHGQSYILFSHHLLKTRLVDLLQLLCKSSVSSRRLEGISEATLLEEVREAEHGRWQWIHPKEIRGMLADMDNDQAHPVRKVPYKSEFKWLYSA